MKDRRPLRVALAAAVLFVLGSVGTVAASSASPAGPQRQGIWHDKSSQGMGLQFNVLRSNKGIVVQPGELDFELTCSGDGQKIGGIILFFGLNIHVTNHQFGFSKVFLMSPSPSAGRSVPTPERAPNSSPSPP